MRDVKCSACGELHKVARPTKHKAKYMHRFHGRWLTSHANRADTWEASALATNSGKEAQKMAKERDDHAGTWMLWDYQLGKQVCPVVGIKWSQIG